MAKRRSGPRQPEGRRATENAAGLVPPKRVSPLPCSMLEGGCPEEGCRGETRRGEPVLPGPRAALSVGSRVARHHQADAIAFRRRSDP